MKGETALFPKMASLHFQHAITRCHKAFKVVLTEDMKYRMWSSLVELLKLLLKKKSPSVKFTMQTLLHGERERDRWIDNWSEVQFDCEVVIDLLTEKFVGGRAEGKEDSNILRKERESVTSSNGELQSSFIHERAYKPSVISELYQSLVFDGKLQDQSTELLLAEVQATIASVLASFGMENFQTTVEEIVADVVSKCCYF